MNFLMKKLRSYIFSGKSKSLDSWKDKYSVGKWTYGEPQVLSWDDGTNLTVGSFCSIAHGVQIFLGGNHRVNFISTYPFAEILKRPDLARGSISKGSVVVGNDVWLGTKCAILSGVTIGDGAVIGAYSVVAKDIPAYSIAVGNPARVIKKRFSDLEIQALLRIRWWNWLDDDIIHALPLIMSSNVDELKNYYESIIMKKYSLNV